MLLFSLNTRACSVGKATLQQSPGKQGEETLVLWPDLWDYRCPGTQDLIRKADSFVIAFSLKWSFS